ncbi:MAG: hypothetical protein OXG11_07745 [Chloroflexi bacterium]|nr:hypothetical protein [Chloroflexota bacterium]
MRLSGTWNRSVARTVAVAFLAFAVVVLFAFWISPVAADHDGENQDWRYQTFLDCLPVWDPAKPGTQTWDGKNLHSEPDDVRMLFWETWGAANGETDLLAGIHVRRWRWEYECLHPPPAPTPTPTPTPRPSVRTTTHAVGSYEWCQQEENRDSDLYRENC